LAFALISLFEAISFLFWGGDRFLVAMEMKGDRGLLGVRWRGAPSVADRPTYPRARSLFCGEMGNYRFREFGRAIA